MSYDNPTERWEIEDIDRMLAILPIIEAEGFVSHTYPEPEVTIINGVKSWQIPYPTYHPVVKVLWDECYQSSAWIHPYERLPEDPPTLEDLHLAQEVFPTLESFAEGTLNQIRRYLIHLTRLERFSDCFIASEFESNRLPAALRRLQTLRREMTA